jgi:hypothetical protein
MEIKLDELEEEREYLLKMCPADMRDTICAELIFFHESCAKRYETGCEIMCSAIFVCGFHFLMCRTRTIDINTLDFIMSPSPKI